MACLSAERALVHGLGAGCETPVGAHCRFGSDGRATLTGWVGLPDGSEWLRDELTGDVGELGIRCAERMLAAGAAGLLRRAAAQVQADPEQIPTGHRGRAVTVYLVGAGPGDPGLLTVRARELIAAADVIVYDRLIPETALDGARSDAELLYAGKQGGGASVPQDEIGRLLVAHGRSGRTVVRLKGGDPFVFGRGGEEAELLRRPGSRLRSCPGSPPGSRRPRTPVFR